MIFRVLFLMSYIVFAMNLGTVAGIPAANVIEKGIFLLSAVAYIWTRKIDSVGMLLLISTGVLVFGLALSTEYPNFEWSIFLNSLNQLWIIFALLIGIPTERDRDVILRGAALLPLGCVLLGFAYQIMGWRELFGQEFSTGLFRFQASLIPAYLSGVAMCGTFAALQMTLAKKSSYIWLIGLNLIILLMAGGRAALVVTAIVCGASILLKRHVKFDKKILFLFSGLVASLIMATVFWSRIATRFISSGENGRDIMWSYLLELADNYRWTGIGFGHQYFAVPHEVVIRVGSAAAHNDFVRLALELGYAGMAMFYILLSLTIFRIMTRRKMRADLTMLMAFGGFLLLSRTDNALASPPYFPLVFLAVLSSITFQQIRHDPRRKITSTASPPRSERGHDQRLRGPACYWQT